MLAAGVLIIYRQLHGTYIMAPHIFQHKQESGQKEEKVVKRKRDGQKEEEER